MNIQSASSCWSSYPYKKAIKNLLTQKTVEPLIGVLSTNHVQLCPQHSDYLSDELIEFFMQTYKYTQFRLHSDVRLKNKKGYTIDLSDFNEETKPYFKELARMSKKMKAPVYSLHAGKRLISLNELKNKYARLQDIFEDCTVAVEVLYPFKNNHWLLDKWQEYEWLLNNDIKFALDLSHAYIVEQRYGKNDDLVNTMIASPLCTEIHISFNDGKMDSHYLATDEHNTKYKSYLEQIKNKQEHCVVFSEGNQVLHQKKLAKTL